MYGSTRCVCRAIFIFLINTILLIYTRRSILPLYRQGVSFAGLFYFKGVKTMNRKMYETLEFNKVLNMFGECALSEKTKDRVKRWKLFFPRVQCSGT